MHITCHLCGLQEKNYKQVFRINTSKLKTWSHFGKNISTLHYLRFKNTTLDVDFLDENRLNRLVYLRKSIVCSVIIRPETQRSRCCERVRKRLDCVAENRLNRVDKLTSCQAWIAPRQSDSESYVGYGRKWTLGFQHTLPRPSSKSDVDLVFSVVLNLRPNIARLTTLDMS